MSKTKAANWGTKPGSKEFRLSNVDGNTTVDIGQQDKFKNKLGPGWRAEKWNGIGWMNVIGNGVKLNKEGVLKSDPKRGEFYECECLRNVKGNDKAERHIILPGSTEYQIEWDAYDDIPDTGYVELLLEFSEDLIWYKQPALTQEEINRGVIQEENTINAYAIYGKNSGRYIRDDGSEIINFGTGKFCDVYRPCLIDANNNRCWLDQTAPLSSPNRLRINLDINWLSDAAFPVTLDPTFGYTGTGLLTDYPGTNNIACFQASPASNGVAESVSVYGDVYGGTAPRQMTFGLYSDSSGNPSTLLADSAGATYASSGFGWKRQLLDSSPAVVSGTNYWNAFNFNCWLAIKFDGSGGDGYKYKAQTYSNGSLLASISSPSSTGSLYKYSVYCTYIVGWGHKIHGIANANIAKVFGTAKANIAKIFGT